MPNELLQTEVLIALGGLIFLIGFMAGGSLVFWMWARANGD